MNARCATGWAVATCAAFGVGAVVALAVTIVRFAGDADFLLLDDDESGDVFDRDPLTIYRGGLS